MWLAGKATLEGTCRLYRVPYEAARFPFEGQSHASVGKLGGTLVVRVTAVASGVTSAPPTQSSSTAVPPLTFDLRLGQPQLQRQAEQQQPGKQWPARASGSGWAGGLGGSSLSLQDAHLLCQAALLVYEDVAVVREVLAGCAARRRLRVAPPPPPQTFPGHAAPIRRLCAHQYAAGEQIGGRPRPSRHAAV